MNKAAFFALMVVSSGCLASADADPPAIREDIFLTGVSDVATTSDAQVLRRSIEASFKTTLVQLSPADNLQPRTFIREAGPVAVLLQYDRDVANVNFILGQSTITFATADVSCITLAWLMRAMSERGWKNRRRGYHVAPNLTVFTREDAPLSIVEAWPSVKAGADGSPCVDLLAVRVRYGQ